MCCMCITVNGLLVDQVAKLCIISLTSDCIDISGHRCRVGIHLALAYTNYSEHWYIYIYMKEDNTQLQYMHLHCECATDMMLNMYAACYLTRCDDNKSTKILNSICYHLHHQVHDPALQDKHRPQASMEKFPELGGGQRLAR